MSRVRFRTGVLVASSNMSIDRTIINKVCVVKYRFVQKIFGNVIIKTETIKNNGKSINKF